MPNFYESCFSRTTQNRPGKIRSFIPGLSWCACALYVGFVLFTRYECNRDFERRDAEQKAEKRREDDRRTVEQLGGSDLAIRSLLRFPTTDSSR